MPINLTGIFCHYNISFALHPVNVLSSHIIWIHNAVAWFKSFFKCSFPHRRSPSNFMSSAWLIYFFFYIPLYFKISLRIGTFFIRRFNSQVTIHWHQCTYYFSVSPQFSYCITVCVDQTHTATFLLFRPQP